MTSYHCETCKRKHKIFRGLEMPPPALITEMPKAEQAERIHDFGVCVIVDKLQIFINGYLYVFLEGEAEPFFSWHVWAELDGLDFHGKSNKLREGEPIAVKGSFIGIPMLYDHPGPLNCMVTIFPDEDIHSDIVVTEQCQLQHDQSKPITLDRMKEIMNRLHHAGDFSREKEVFTESFTLRFNELLDEVMKTYTDQGEDFCINLLGKHVVSLQVVSSGVLEEALDENKGFGLHFPFDPSDPEMVLQRQRFLSLPMSESFTYHEWDGIPTYQLDVGADRKRLAALVDKIVSFVFQEEVDQLGFDHHML